MRKTDTPIVKDLALIGGGHAHVAVLKTFGMRPLPGVRLTLITRDIHTPYSGMLPGFIAGHYDYDEAHIDLGVLATFAGARLIHATVSGLNTDDKHVICAGRPPIPYDVLSINIGSRPRMPTGGSGEDPLPHVLPVKPIDRFLDGWNGIIRRVAETRRVFRLCIVGTGAGGVEMSLAARFKLRGVLARNGKPPEWIHITLIGANRQILPTHNRRARARFTRALRERDVELITNETVTGADDAHVYSAHRSIPADAVIWTTDAAAQPWPREAGLEVDSGGFIRVNACLQSTGDADVFAAGDIAAVRGQAREKSGVFAVRQGPPLSENLRRRLLGRPLRAFRAQEKFLSLISTGDKSAVASRGEWSLQGRAVWRWKDWIDRRFMRKYAQLPEMEEPAAVPRAMGFWPGKGVGGIAKGLGENPADAQTLRELSTIAMRCGGCGAKVGNTVLSRVVNRLRDDMQTRDHPDVFIGLGAPDDAAVLAIPQGKALVQSVDYFRAFVADAYLFGRIAANHALGDLYAMGAEPQSALAIATVPYGPERIVEDQLYQLMSGALATLNEGGVALVGGHSSEGAELAFGLAANGVGDPRQLLKKSGMRPGDKLILTKPIGTGTLLAADMRGKAKGRWTQAALAMMTHSNARAAQILSAHNATACTDVTGFGLLGHLVEMTRASQVDAVIHTAAIPLLPGAAECVARGIFSSLQPQNTRLRRAILDTGFNRATPIFALLFDPQTAGGLLATVPADQADACAAALRAAGYATATIIGATTESAGEGGPVRLE